MKNFNNQWRGMYADSGSAKYVFAISIVMLLSSLINLSSLTNALQYPLIVFPVFWVLWIGIDASSSKPTFRTIMRLSWAMLAIVLLLCLLERASPTSWSTSRQYVSMQDLTCLGFSPIVFPAGLIPELIGETVQLLPFVGSGAVHRLEISHGLTLSVVLTWAKYCCASMLETWAIEQVLDKVRASRQSHKRTDTR